jgi:DNA invertase Pin-like site-specific DNA recombinase
LEQKTQAVLYARVSSKEQEKDGFSIPAQQKLLRQYASDHGIVVSCEFTDVETAKRSGRTGFGEMFAYLRRNPTCRTILVEKTDRLYRNTKDWVTIDELDAEIHFVKENVVLSAASRSHEKFMHGIKVLMAKNFIDNLSEETRKGMLEKAEQGIWPSFAPLGYLNFDTPNGKRTIVPDPSLAPIICQIYEWYATGLYSLADVTKRAKAAGMVFRKSGNAVPKGTVHKILHNRIYTGDFDFGGKTYRGCYEPIVTRELWQWVQQVLQQRLGPRRQRRKHDFAFSGMITCTQCGCALVGEMKKGRYVYYHCTCAKHYVREEVLEAEFAKAIRQIVFAGEFLTHAKIALQQFHSKETEEREQTIVRLKAEQTKLERRIDAMYNDKLDGMIDEATFKRKRDECRNEQARLAAEIKRLAQARPAYVDNLAELGERVADLFEQQPAREKRKLLHHVVEQCKWTEGALTYRWKPPFERAVRVEVERVA